MSTSGMLPCTLKNLLSPVEKPVSEESSSLSKGQTLVTSTIPRFAGFIQSSRNSFGEIGFSEFCVVRIEQNRVKAVDNILPCSATGWLILNKLSYCVLPSAISVMETHRYVRSHLTSSSVDSYNSILSSPQHVPLEYWTNGKVTEYYTIGSMATSNTNASSRNNVLRRLTRLPKDGNNVRHTLIAGSCAGICSTILLYPMDFMRTKLQTSTARPRQVFADTLRHGGIRALYTGLSLPLAAQAVYKSTVFTINNIMQNIIVDLRSIERQKFGRSPLTIQDLGLFDRFVCGAVAGGVNAAAFVTPVEFVRNQQIAYHTKLAAVATPNEQSNNLAGPKYFRGAWDVIIRSVRHNGVSSLWRGTFFAVARDAIGCGCFFVTMEMTQRQLTLKGEKPSLAITIFSGGLGGLAFWASALPLDTVKTWIQSSDVEKKTISARSELNCIFQKRGTLGVLKRLFRGWQVAYSRGIPSAAITISSYCFVYEQLQEKK